MYGMSYLSTIRVDLESDASEASMRRGIRRLPESSSGLLNGRILTGKYGLIVQKADIHRGSSATGAAAQTHPFPQKKIGARSGSDPAFPAVHGAREGG